MPNAYTEYSTNNTSSTTPKPNSEKILKEDLKFLIVPLVVVVLVLFFSALVYLMARRKRNEMIRQNILKLYEFDPNEEEWETPLLSSQESTSSRNYKTTTF